MTERQKKGQYFTNNPILQKTVCDLIKNNSEYILEPSVGRGDLIKYVRENKNFNTIFHSYEIDDTIELLDGIDRNQIIYRDFLEANIDRKYRTIIGNPPFVKKSGTNLYIEFVEKCYNLLEPEGELIFIVPSNFFKITSSCGLISEMLLNGSFTDVFHPNDEKLFDDASVDVIVFRYCKNLDREHKTLFNGELKYLINKNGIVTFENELLENSVTIDSLFDVYVGMVSGKDGVFKNNEFGNVSILMAKNKVENFILLDEYPTENIQLNEYLLDKKQILINRRIRNFNDDNWWQWGAVRNIKNINKNLGRQCIYISTMSRSEDIAFVDLVRFFGGGLLILIPKNDNMGGGFLQKVTTYFNSPEFKKNYLYSGRFKIGQRQISNCQICPDHI
jgi:adenine-specific DNA-methyltransferase